MANVSGEASDGLILSDEATGAKTRQAGASDGIVLHDLTYPGRVGEEIRFIAKPASFWFQADPTKRGAAT